MDPLVYLQGSQGQVASSSGRLPLDAAPPVPAASRTSRAVALGTSATESASGPPVPSTTNRRESRRLIYPRGAYGRRAVQVVKGSDIETVEF